MPIFQKPALKLPTNKKRDMPEGLWQKCPECGEVIHNLELVKNLKVCPNCDHHFTMLARERADSLLDPGTFEEFDSNMTSVDVLNFKGVASYGDRLKSYQEKTGMKDAVLTGTGKLENRVVEIAVMDFSFLAATMGSVVGEKITRLIERGTRDRKPVIIVSASGGARMYEGMLSLMQMAKTSGALARRVGFRRLRRPDALQRGIRVLGGRQGPCSRRPAQRGHREAVKHRDPAPLPFGHGPVVVLRRHGGLHAGGRTRSARSARAPRGRSHPVRLRRRHAAAAAALDRPARPHGGVNHALPR